LTIALWVIYYFSLPVEKHSTKQHYGYTHGIYSLRRQSKKYPFKTLYEKPLQSENLTLIPPSKRCFNTSGSKILVTYCYYQDANNTLNAHNFKFFLHHAVERYFPLDEGIVDYVIIINGYLHDGIDFPDLCNVWIVKRENSMDFCAYRMVLGAGVVDLSEYNYFFFINAEVVGPFLPSYWNDSWVVPFLNRFDASTRVAIVGPYISCMDSPHVNSPMFVLNSEGLQLVRDLWLCKGHEETIEQMEVPQSTKLLDAGYNLGSLIFMYQNLNVTKDLKCNNLQNPFFFGMYDTNNITKFLYFNSVFEVVFVKYGRRSPQEQDIVLAYMEHAENIRLKCPQCWKNFYCQEGCNLI